MGLLEIIISILLIIFIITFATCTFIIANSKSEIIKILEGKDEDNNE